MTIPADLNAAHHEIDALLDAVDEVIRVTSDTRFDEQVYIETRRAYHKLKAAASALRRKSRPRAVRSARGVVQQLPPEYLLVATDRGLIAVGPEWPKEMRGKRVKTRRSV